MSEETRHADTGRAIPLPKGPWNETRDYEVMDIVAFDGVSYIAMQNVPAGIPVTNPEYWCVMTSKGDAATIEVGTVTQLEPEELPTVENSGTTHAAVFDFGIPKGDKGDKGDAATIAVGTVTKLGPEELPTVENSGTEYAAVFDFGIPQGKKGEKGDSLIPCGEWDNATAYDPLSFVTKDGAAYFAIQAVPAGTLVTDTEYWMKSIAGLSIGTVTTVAYDAGASATITGTPDAPVLNLSLPRGVSGNESIDDTAGEGDDDVVWSADQAWKVTQGCLHGYGSSNVGIATFVQTYGSANGAPKQTVILVTGNNPDYDMTNYGFPVNEAGLLTTMSKSTANSLYGTYQLFFSASNDYWIRYSYGGTYSAWKKIIVDPFIVSDRDKLMRGIGTNLISIETANSTSVREVTITSATDGTITYNGTVTSANPASRSYSKTRNVDAVANAKFFELEKGRKYKFGYQYISGSGSSTYASLRIRNTDSNEFILLDVNNFDTEAVFDVASNMSVEVRLYGSNGATYNNWKIKPYLIPLDSNPIKMTPSVFTKIAVVGDSFASGISGEEGTAYDMSWLQMMAREYGCTGHNFAKGGLTTRTWLTSSYGKTALQAAESCNLYFVALGINDSNPDDRNVPLGTIDDMDMETIPDTYFGNMKKIRDVILGKNEHAVICYITPQRIGTRYSPYQDACVAIAEKYGCLCIDWRDVVYRTCPWWMDNLKSSHPRAVMYNAMMHSIVDALSEAIEHNMTYMADYPDITNS